MSASGQSWPTLLDYHLLYLAVLVHSLTIVFLARLFESNYDLNLIRKKFGATLATQRSFLGPY